MCVLLDSCRDVLGDMLDITYIGTRFILPRGQSLKVHGKVNALFMVEPPTALGSGR